jgi:L-idonate 5-dehydrogenase
MSRGIVIHAAGDLRVETVSPEQMGPRDVAVAVAVGGICGSDLHYYRHGGFGTVRLKEPMVLGHEIAGTVREVGSEVARVKIGDKIAVNPSRPCGVCRFCQAGLQNHCLEMQFFGSAMRFPHVQGGFRERLIVNEQRCVVVPAGMPLGHAAVAEPLSVALHAARRAGDMLGKRVLITGSGPIGVLAVAAARLSGALEIAITDLWDEPLAIARRMGADTTISIGENSEGALTPYMADKGSFDVLIEASGNAAALHSGLSVVKPRGVAVLVGMGGDASVPLNTVVAKEIDLRGTFRFHEEFALAAEYLASKRVDVSPMISDTIGFADATRAFDLATDRRKSMKVQLAFS